ncbi:alpha-2-macroglobulin, partial [Trichonephila inaurata madagascariensis]
YKVPDQITNMVVVSIKMPSGYVPNEWKLHELQSKTALQMKRHELDGNQVNLYFNEVTNTFCMNGIIFVISRDCNDIKQLLK